jgi:hypothetical protein
MSRFEQNFPLHMIDDYQKSRTIEDARWLKGGANFQYGRLFVLDNHIEEARQRGEAELEKGRQKVIYEMWREGAVMTESGRLHVTDKQIVSRWREIGIARTPRS